MKKFHYQNTEKYNHDGKHETRKVCIKGGKGYKSITKKYKGKNRTIKRMLKSHEIHKIKNKKFIKGLFKTCC